MSTEEQNPNLFSLDYYAGFIQFLDVKVTHDALSLLFTETDAKSIFKRFLKSPNSIRFLNCLETNEQFRLSRWYVCALQSLICRYRASEKICPPENQLDANDHYFFTVVDDNVTYEFMSMIFKDDWKTAFDSLINPHGSSLGSWWLTLSRLHKRRIVDFVADYAYMKQQSPLFFKLKVRDASDVCYRAPEIQPQPETQNPTLILCVVSDELMILFDIVPNE